MDYAEVLQVFFLFFKRIDIVFDVYLESSLKAATHEKREKGVRRRVSSEGRCPTNWMMFLKKIKTKMN